MSTDQSLRDRVEELEQRIERLEQQTDSDDNLTAKPLPGELAKLDPISTEFRENVHAKDIIADIPGTDDDGAPVDDVIAQLEAEGFDDPNELIDRLRRQGDIYQPDSELIKVV